MLNQHHKSQLRGEKKRQKSYSWKTFSEWSETNERKRISREKRYTRIIILDYHGDSSVTIIKSMRIKRESPCLGLRFMPIKLSKYLPDSRKDVFLSVVTSELNFLCWCRCVCVSSGWKAKFFASGFPLASLISREAIPHLFTIITGWIASEEESRCLLILASLVFLFFSFWPFESFEKKTFIFSIFSLCVERESSHRSCELLLYGRRTQTHCIARA